MINIIRIDSDNKDFVELAKYLDADLAEKDGSDHSFYAQFNKINKIKHAAVAYENNLAVACGAIKYFSADTIEVKRMYPLQEFRRKGVATKLLVKLESWATELRFKRCVLETGQRQPEALALKTGIGLSLIMASTRE